MSVNGNLTYLLYVFAKQVQFIGTYIIYYVAAYFDYF